MAYIYAALTLYAAGKEISEANLKRVIEVIGTQIDEAELSALTTLVTALKAQKRVEAEGREAENGEVLPASEKLSLEERLRGLEDQMAQVNDRLSSIELTIHTQQEPVGRVSEEKPQKTEAPKAESEEPPETEGRYIYCVADGGAETSFGNIGIDGNEVYTIPYEGISAVAHSCSPELYKSDDEEIVKGWVTKHQDVVDAAWEKFGSVLPFRFDTVIKGDATVVRDWLKGEFENFKGKLDKFRDKIEVGVQISWDPKVIGREIAEASEKIRGLKEEMGKKPEGMAYLYKQKIEEALKEEMGKKADEYFRDFYERIKKHAEDIRVEKPKKLDDKQMLMNLSLLIHKDKTRELGGELGKINEMSEFDVKYTGPWPPYSFVSG
ncbi:MAG: gas vesicle protein GvpL [Candidatus Bathyarchaeia archaeon]